MAEKQHKSERLMAGTLGHAVGEATRAAVSAATEAALEKEYIGGVISKTSQPCLVGVWF